MANPNPKLENLELGRGKRPKLNHIRLTASVSEQTKEALEAIALQYNCIYGEEPWIAELLTKIGSGELMVVPSPPLEKSK